MGAADTVGGTGSDSNVVEADRLSERHFARQFNHHLGLRPKAFARVLRFGRAVRRLAREGDARLADVALDCGYYDQAHFTRDFREFAGVTAAELLASRRPAGSGFRAAL